MSNLNDDLLKDFKDQKEMIYQQVKEFDILGVQLRLPAARKLVGKPLLICGEVLCYLLGAGAASNLFFADKIQAMYILADLKKSPGNFNPQQTQYLYYGVFGLVGFTAALLFALGICMRYFRLKNDILNTARLQTISIAGELLQRKAAIDAIEQRHFTELPSLSEY